MPILDLAANWLSENLTTAGIGVFLLIGFWQVRKKSRQGRVAEKILKDAISTNMHEPLTMHPEIDPAKCAGCGSCTAACPEGSILRLIDHKAVLVEPTSCVGHGECEAACPTGAISLVFGTKTRGMDIPRITTHYETNVPGLYIAGELGGMGLIRNAVKQGHLAAKHALENLSPTEKSLTDVDLLVIGAGPAGLASSLTAITKNARYLCIDQNNFGGTVYNFPRQKVVMSKPADLPVIGKMKFRSDKVSKEELLSFWQDVCKKTGLKVREKVRFESLEKTGGFFTVKTSAGVVKAQKVILCMGVRGTPRKLGVPNEDLPKVTYNLIDPEQYQNMDIAVVGGGNAGVEAAQMLADPKYKNRVVLLVRGNALDRCNAENKRIINEMCAKKLVQIWYESAVKDIQPQSIAVTTPQGQKTIPNHYLFVFAGAEMPHKFLMSLGIKIEKKFGETLGV